MSFSELSLAALTTVAASSAGGALVASLLNNWWGRRAEKKAPKTEMRAKAYEDFVTYFVAGPSAELHLQSITARLALYGESSVLVPAADFLSTYPDLDSPEAIAAFVAVVRRMRASLLTGHGDQAAENIQRMVSSAQAGWRASQP